MSEKELEEIRSARKTERCTRSLIYLLLNAAFAAGQGDPEKVADALDKLEDLVVERCITTNDEALLRESLDDLRYHLRRPEEIGPGTLEGILGDIGWGVQKVLERRCRF